MLQKPLYLVVVLVVALAEYSGRRGAFDEERRGYPRVELGAVHIILRHHSSCVRTMYHAASLHIPLHFS